MAKTKPYHDLVLHVSRSALDKCWVYQIVYEPSATYYPIIYWLWFHLGQEIERRKWRRQGRIWKESISILTYCLMDETNKTIGSWNLYDAKLTAIRVINRILKHYNKHEKKGGRK